MEQLDTLYNKEHQLKPILQTSCRLTLVYIRTVC